MKVNKKKLITYTSIYYIEPFDQIILLDWQEAIAVQFADAPPDYKPVFIDAFINEQRKAKENK